MKICPNCGDKLLDAAKKCPSCGTKDKGNFQLVNSNDHDAINQIIANVPNPRKSVVTDPLKERISQMDRDGTAYCPKCHSTSLSADKKGFGVGKAVVGAFVAGPVGLVAGNIGARKVRVTCLKCGHQFMAGNK